MMPPGHIAPIEQITAADHIIGSMRTYAELVNIERALADPFAGMKMVNVRIIAAMMGLGDKSRLVKAARVVGEAMGKYHPHGDGAIYAALVTMTQSRVPFVEGQGNWGTLIDPPAAMRYTECRLSDTARKFLIDSEYISVCPTVETFDSANTYCLNLPALAPWRVINGSNGIGVGAGSRAFIPPFEPNGVLMLADYALQGGTVTPEMCAAYLRISYGNLAKGFLRTQFPCVTDGNGQTFELQHITYHQTGAGSAKWCPVMEVDRKTKTIRFTSVHAQFSDDRKDTEKKLEAIKSQAKLANITFRDVSDSGGLKREIVLGSRATEEQLQAAFAEAQKQWTKTVSYRSIMVERWVNVYGDISGRLVEWPTHEVIMRWAEYRKNLEVAMQTVRRAKLVEELSRTTLLALIIDNLPIYTQALSLDGDDAPEAYLMAQLGLTRDQADYIMTFTGRRLKRVNRNEISRSIETLNGKIQACDVAIADPVPACRSKLEEIREHLESIGLLRD